MRDQISASRVQALHPAIRESVTAFIDEAEAALNVTLRITQGLRTIEQQNELFAQGRTKPGKVVTKARGGQSYHNYGLAIDLVELKDGQANWNFKYELLVPFAEKHGFAWGGHFKSILDKPHFEKTFGHSWKELLRRHDLKKFVSNTNYVILA